MKKERKKLLGVVGQNPNNKDICIYIEKHPNNLISFSYTVSSVKTRTRQEQTPRKAGVERSW